MECLANVLEQKFPRFNIVSPHHSLRDALYQMSYENLDYLIVQDGAGFIGLLSEQDVAHKLFSSNKPLEELQVKDIMNCSVPVGSVDDEIEFAIQILNRYNSRYIAVFDQLTFRGIVSENDLLKQIIANNELSLDAPAYRETFHLSY